MKKTPLGLGKNYKGLKKAGLKTNSKPLIKTRLKKQSDTAKELWTLAREACIARCSGKCVVCGKVGTQVHHIHLRSKRRDLLYNQNNLVLLCDLCHSHSSSERLTVVNSKIAHSKNISLQELLDYAEKD
jgi:5-methylcytosine-specific restriction endonuclease McrA